MKSGKGVESTKILRQKLRRKFFLSLRIQLSIRLQWKNTTRLYSINNKIKRSDRRARKQLKKNSLVVLY
jgi:hypothetical protein